MATRQVTPERDVPTISVRTLEYELWLLVTLTLVGDIITTYVGLQLGLTESNTLTASIIDATGVFGVIVLKMFVVGLVFVCRPLLPIAYRPIMPAGLALPWLLPVWIIYG